MAEDIERIIALLQESDLSTEQYRQITQPAVNYLVGRIKEECEHAYATNDYKKVVELATVLDKINKEVSLSIKQSLIFNKNGNFRAISTAKI